MKRFDAEDPERPPIVKYDPAFKVNKNSKLIMMLTPHPRFSFHTQGDAKDTFINDISDHRVRVMDMIIGLLGLIVRTLKKKIKSNDLVKVFNDQGAVMRSSSHR